MDAYLVSTFAVAVAELGDKTQFLALLLVARYGRPGVIACGIAIATLANHGIAAWLGATAAHLLDPVLARWVLAAAFAAMAVWVLVPEDEAEAEEEVAHVPGRSVLTATVLLFFLTEMADKSQIATAALGARFPGELLAVVAGTTTGALVANVPLLYGGATVFRRLPIVWVRRVAALVFVVLALVTAFLVPAPG